MFGCFNRMLAMQLVIIKHKHDWDKQLSFILLARHRRPLALLMFSCELQTWLLACLLAVQGVGELELCRAARLCSTCLLNYTMSTSWPGPISRKQMQNKSRLTMHAVWVTRYGNTACKRKSDPSQSYSQCGWGLVLVIEVCWGCLSNPARQMMPGCSTWLHGPIQAYFLTTDLA